MEFSRLERAAIEAILSKPVDGMEVVREQFAAATALERDYAGVGFYTKISVPSSIPLIPNSQELRVALFHTGVARPKSDPKGLIIFHLWTNGGYLSCLEGVTVRDTWPDEDDIEVLKPSEIRTEAGKRPSEDDIKVFKPCEIPRDASMRFSADDLMPDCENRFAVWRMNTSFRRLLATALCALLVAMIAAFIATILLPDLL